MSRMRHPYINFAKQLIKTKVADYRSTPVIPLKLTLVSTHLCNSRCRTCGIWNIYSKGKNKDLLQKELTIDQLKLIVESFGPHLFWLNITGGEPTLKPGIPDLIRHAKENCPNLFMINIPLNGILPLKTEKFVNQIVSENPEIEIHITLSIDGIGEKQDYIRGYDGHWERSIETWERLNKLRSANENLKCSIQTTISSFNIEHADRIKSRFSKESDHYMAGIAQISHFFNNSNIKTRFVTSSKLSKHVTKITDNYSFRPWQLTSYFQIIYWRLASLYVKFGTPGISCAASTVTVTIDPYGKVMPCPFLPDSMGELKQYDFDIHKLLMKSPEALKIIKKVKHCSACWDPCVAYISIMRSPIRSLYRTFCMREKPFFVS